MCFCIYRSYQLGNGSNNRSAGIIVFQNFQVGDRVVVYQTVLLGIAHSVKGQVVTAKISKTIYANFAIAPLVLFVTSCIGLIFRRTVNVAFSAGLICLLLLIMMGVLYLILP